MQESGEMPTEGVILSGVFEKTGLYLDGSLENPMYGCRRCKQKENFCESLRQKDSEVLNSCIFMFLFESKEG